MLITDGYVLLNMPKTGSTFARKVIKTIHDDRQRLRGNKAPAEYVELILPNIKVPGRPADQHGTFDQIPTEHAGKTIVSMVRNPFEKLASSYRFGWWKEYPGVPRETVVARFPHFPDLDFADYVALTQMSAARKLGRPNDLNIGNQTLQFVQMYFRDASSVISRLSGEYIHSGDYARDMPAMVFLRSEFLNQDLANFLASMGYDEAEVQLCRNHPAVNVTQLSAQCVLWTPRLIELVQESERLLLRILSDIGIRYSPPVLADVQQI